jgi:hypothetical protein
MSNDLFRDPRFGFLRQRVLIALEMGPEHFDAYFTDSLERARSAGLAREQVKSYFSKVHGIGSSLFFSCQKSFEEVEGMFDSRYCPCGQLA